MLRQTTLFLAAVAIFTAAGCSQSSATPPSTADDPLALAAPAKAVSSRPAELKLGEWPHWRGPHHDGISRETDWTTKWPDGGPKRIWKAAVGTGFSSVSVVGGMLYTMGHVEGNDIVWCLDAADGQMIWQHKYPCKLVDNLHEGGPAATPTVDGDRVYTVSKEGHLFCLDANKGTVIWQQHFQELFKVKMPEWGFSCSPLVVGGAIIVDAGHVAAFNKKTGELIWKTEAAYKPGYGSAIRWQFDDRDLLAVLNNQFLLIVNTKDGSEVAKAKWETSFVTTAATPIILGKSVFISSGYDRGCALFELKGSELEKIYENKEMRNHMANCVLIDGYLYGFDGNSHLRRTVSMACMKLDTGKTAWKERGLGCGTLMAADGKLILLGDEGELVIAPASPEGFKPIVKAQVIDGRCWTVPVLAGGRIFARNAAGDLVCLDVRK